MLPRVKANEFLRVAGVEARSLTVAVP